MRQTSEQKRFTISKVAADCVELMIPQRTMRPFIIAGISEHYYRTRCLQLAYMPSLQL